MTTARQKLTAKVRSLTTEELFIQLDLATGLVSTTEGNDKRAAQITKTTVCDVLEARHNLGDELDEIYMDEAYEGSYTDALRLAYANVTGNQP